MSAISQTTFWNAFPWMKTFVFWFEFHWSFFVWVQLTISKHWFRWWLGTEQVTSHYLNQCWPSSLTNICGTRERWVNAFGPCEMWQQSYSVFSNSFYIIVAWALMWTCSQVNITEPHKWKVNIGSGIGFVPSGNKPLPEPMLTQIYVTISNKQAMN